MSMPGAGSNVSMSICIRGYVILYYIVTSQEFAKSSVKALLDVRCFANKGFVSPDYHSLVT